MELAPQSAARMTGPVGDEPVGLGQALEQCRAGEREQAGFYRALAAAAEEAGNDALAERFNELHADEQHHLSRLTARLVELGRVPTALERSRSVAPDLDAWQRIAAEREAAEIARYQTLLGAALDGVSRALILQILESERMHARNLGGKWMPA